MKIRSTLLALAVVASPLSLAACGSACGDLPQPSQRDIEAAQNGYEVEREGNYDAECELTPGGTWQEDD